MRPADNDERPPAGQPGAEQSAWVGAGVETRAYHRCRCDRCMWGIRPRLELGRDHVSDWHRLEAAGIDPLTGEPLREAP